MILLKYLKIYYIYEKRLLWSKSEVYASITFGLQHD